MAHFAQLGGPLLSHGTFLRHIRPRRGSSQLAKGSNKLCSRTPTEPELLYRFCLNQQHVQQTSVQPHEKITDPINPIEMYYYLQPNIDIYITDYTWSKKRYPGFNFDIY